MTFTPTKKTPSCNSSQPGHEGASDTTGKAGRQLHSSTNQAQAASWRALWNLLLSPEARRVA